MQEKVELDIITKPILEDIHIDMKSGDFLAVVG
jgi:ABC-type cobalamin/Fe3+-siderophores transport system ATPase subunit